MLRLGSFSKYFAIGVVAGGLVAARHCFDILSETSLEVDTVMRRIDHSSAVLAYTADVSGKTQSAPTSRRPV